MNLPDPERPTPPPFPDAPPEEPTPDPKPNSWIAQLLLDPRGLQVLMGAGSGLLALGLVLWLAVKGVFDEPLNAAIGLGVANFALLGGGVWLSSRTRHALAGRATAMLACVLLPLNLWFCDAQGLVTLSNGGHLWLPALVCCVAYAGVARLLKDSLFVYAFTAGVAMTGMLFLADGQVGRFWEVLAPSTLLVVLGVACIHAERLFPPSSNDTVLPFTRDNFGRAFFRAGHVLLASGLGVLLAGRVAGRFYETFFADLQWFVQPHVATMMNAKLAAVGLALAGAYAYGYSRFVSREESRYSLFALLALLWSGLIGLDVLGIALTETLLVALLAVAALAFRLTKDLLPVGTATHGLLANRSDLLVRVSNVAGSAALGLLLFQLLRGFWSPWLEWIEYSFSWGSVVAAALVLLAEWSSARKANDEEQVLGASRLVRVALASLAVAASLLPLVVGAMSSQVHLLVLLAVPTVWLAAGLFVPRERRASLLGGGEVAACLLGVLALPYVAVESSVLTLVTTVGLAALFTAFAAMTKRRVPAALAVGCVLSACAQAVLVFALEVYLPLLTLTAACLAAVALDRFGAARGIGMAGRLGLLVAALAGGLLAGQRLLVEEADLKLLGMLAGQTVMTAATVGLSKREEGRYGLLTLAVVQLLMTGLVLNAVSVLTFPQRLEVFCTAVGLGLVVGGLVGWRRETSTGVKEDHSLVDANLWLGALLATLPMTVGLLGVRLFGGSAAWVSLHELGVLAIGLGFVAIGVMCRLRATTLTGAGSLVVYLLSLVTLIHLPDQLQTVAFYMMAGGGGLFTAAVLLSVYRDRLLELPGRVREGKGVFAVMKWR